MRYAAVKEISYRPSFLEDSYVLAEVTELFSGVMQSVAFEQRLLLAGMMLAILNFLQLVLLGLQIPKNLVLLLVHNLKA